jgi:hypothetical protein
MCAFGVPSGKLLGFLVSQHGIKANTDKVKAIEEMCPPRNLKEMQRLVGCMAALGRFIARSGEKALPFFKLMKCTKKFEWTPEADKAFAELKRYLTSPPIMVTTRPHEPLLLYITATPRTASAILVAERDTQVTTKEKVDAPCPEAPLEEEAMVPASPREESFLHLIKAEASVSHFAHFTTAHLCPLGPRVHMNCSELSALTTRGDAMGSPLTYYFFSS